MQYIQLEGQLPENIDAPLGDSYNIFIDNNGSLSLKNSENEIIISSGQSTTLPNLNLTNSPFIYEPFLNDEITFSQTDGTEVDEIDNNIAITRGSEFGIYNPYFEIIWDDTSNDGISPKNTLWNNEGWENLNLVSERRYYSFYDVLGGRIGNNILDAELIMKDTLNNKFYKFDFTVWGNAGQGAPVTYTRQQIDGVTGENIGNEVQFIKLGYQDPTVVNDQIDNDLTIARGNYNGIYNISLEEEWDSNGDGLNSPEGTLWNAEGWNNLDSINQREFSTFIDVFDYSIEENIIGKELVMHDVINEKYHTFKFTQWDPQEAGGSFTYTRRLINTSNIFNKPNNDVNTIDIFVEENGDGTGIGITRGEGGGIYNPYREESWDETQSPAGTLWNIEGWNNLSNITSRTYMPFYAAFGYGGLGNKVVGTECVMFIPEINKYFAIKFNNWTQGGGGGFSYNRYEIDTNKLNEGIKFADNTILKSAAGLGKVKANYPKGRRIEEVTGYANVDLTESIIENSVEGTVYSNNNGDFSFLISYTPAIAELYNNSESYTKIEFSFDDGNSWVETDLCGNSSEWFQVCFKSQPYETVTTGQSVLYRVTRGGNPVRWFFAEGQNFRGAVIDYHAYSVESGTIVGTIYIANDDGDDNITHTEVKSGSSSLDNIDLWYRNNSEREIWFRRTDTNRDTLKIQWIAKMFYGSEYYD